MVRPQPRSTPPDTLFPIPPLFRSHSDGATIALLAAARRPPGLCGVVAVAAHVFIESCTADGVRRAAESWAASDLPRRLARYHGDKTESVFRDRKSTRLNSSH